MRRIVKSVRKVGGTISLPGDKSIAHRAALFSILSQGPITIRNFPNGADCQRSLAAAQTLGVKVDRGDNELILTPPEARAVDEGTNIDCGNSGTTVRLLAGILAGSQVEATLVGDESLSQRPMKRIIDPLTAMGAELFAENGTLPMRIRGRRLGALEYRMPVASAQVKSALLLAGMASSCSVVVREDIITRDHTEIMMQELGNGLSVKDIKAVAVADPDDPRKRRMQRPEPYKREIQLQPGAVLNGGLIDIPGDFSTAVFFMGAAAISGYSLTVANVGLNPTRTVMLDHLKAVGCSVQVNNRAVVSGEVRGDVTVTGAPLKARKISGDTTVGLIDEIPMVAVMAAFASGTTIIRDAGELRVKESDRLMAVTENLKSIGIKVGLLEDGLAIEGGKDLNGADFKSFGDHRIAMAFSIAGLFLHGSSSIDDDASVAVSCPDFYDLLGQVTQ
ncbi:MAG: 3-phosphoshikimate 1-carboxyvinyltransferase [candidate division Zixibacteria bacterium]|nr:3-phosphoshikimate 1-carboxyvinyltransferase [candidate division Zixibacteria bacterium]MDH3935803.1 3-phosphoshikimate 1-carboxyvinyltransferase [candidate division Zixibacteria bacterium]MDH4034778.1 3-phosphoshikimate 1-carboxyvinyltransferase [candidate division Zixibacteria bacterium]